jgi:ribosomal protein S12 methylthiotransferase accessory factor YcaO
MTDLPTYLLLLVGFTPEVSEMKANLKTLYASGGGDGPEAVTAALFAVTEMVSSRWGSSLARAQRSLTLIS